MRLLVSQGEIGVMYPGNANQITSMVTYGASPCVILGIKKGSTVILAHVHRANSVDRLKAQLTDILASATPGTIRAFISTEPHTSDQMEMTFQTLLVQKLKQMLQGMNIVYFNEYNAYSAAVVDGTSFDLSDDLHVAQSLTSTESQRFLSWAMAYDQRFNGKFNSVPMAIRAGVDSETPQHAMARLYSGQ